MDRYMQTLFDSIPVRKNSGKVNTMLKTQTKAMARLILPLFNNKSLLKGFSIA